jgi:hypothetical protein
LSKPSILTPPNAAASIVRVHPLVRRRFEAVAPQIRALIERANSFGEDEATARVDVLEAIGDLLAADRGFGFRCAAPTRTRRCSIVGRTCSDGGWTNPTASNPMLMRCEAGNGSLPTI